MVLPIYIYGQPVLREETLPVEQNTPELQQLIDDMIETMRAAEGIGLAAPQVGRRERLFVVDLTPMLDDVLEEGPVPPQPMVFINPEITEETEEVDEFEEGCLSIPELREPVVRPAGIKMTYLDRAFEPQEMAVQGLLARVIQHEYDHVEGILFIDYLGSFKRRLLRRRLKDIAEGRFEAVYPTQLAVVS
ncbi:MAG: peptide deformylase [Bacteroidota bacterium]